MSVSINWEIEDLQRNVVVFDAKALSVTGFCNDDHVRVQYIESPPGDRCWWSGFSTDDDRGFNAFVIVANYKNVLTIQPKCQLG